MMMEMKKDWMDPQTIVQDFVPNEYVAACGDTVKSYKFVCDAPVFIAALATDADGKELGWYHPCNATHIVSTTDDFTRGYLGAGPTKREVIIWRGEDGNNIHCTTNLHMDQWEITKS